MHIPFKKLNPSSRIWIYQANKKLSQNEVEIISRHLRAFTDQWTVHGHPLEASFDVRYDRFVIIAANDQTSGCSIDASVRVMKEVGDQTQADFFDRGLVAVKHGEDVRMYSTRELKDCFSNGTLNGTSIVFNNLVESVGDLDQSWLVPASNTWLKRYINSGQVA
jgi:hypothetical protein